MAPGRGRQVLRVGHSGLGLPHRQVPVEASFPLNRACRCLEGSSLWTPDSQLWGGGAQLREALLHPLQVWDCAALPARVGPGGAERGSGAHGTLQPSPFLSLPASVTARGPTWTRASSPASGHRLNFCLRKLSPENKTFAFSHF